MSEQAVLLQRRRSPATIPGYGRGRPPRNKGLRYPADPPRPEEVIAVMRAAGSGSYGLRMRGLVVVLWRAGLRIGEALALSESDLEPSRGALIVRRGKGGKRREVGMDEWAWAQLRPWLARRIELPVGPLFCVIAAPSSGMAWSQTAVRGGTADARAPGGCAAALCPASAPPRPRRRDGARGRADQRDPASARPLQPRRDLGLPTGDRHR